MAVDLIIPTSAYIQAAQLMRPKDVMPKVYVYVEDDIDSVFWRRFLVFDKFSCEFVIKVYQVADKELRGKDAMLSDVQNHKLNLGNRILLCIDSDLDLIIDNYHNYTNTLRNNPFIITTIWYATENLKCYPSNVLTLIYKVTLADEIVIDVPSKIGNVSKLLSSLFLICLVSYKNSDNYYSLDAFGNDLNSLVFNEKGDLEDSSIAALNSIVGKHVQYTVNHKDSIIKMKDYLFEKGYSEETYYCLMRGHDVADKVIKRFVKAVAGYIRDKKLKEIGGKKVDANYKRQLEQQYSNQTGVTQQCCLGNRIDDLVRDCCDFDALPIYNEIENNIRKAIVFSDIVSIIGGIIEYKNKK